METENWMVCPNILSSGSVVNYTMFLLKLKLTRSTNGQVKARGSRIQLPNDPISWEVVAMAGIFSCLHIDF